MRGGLLYRLYSDYLKKLLSIFCAIHLCMYVLVGVISLIFSNIYVRSLPDQ